MKDSIPIDELKNLGPKSKQWLNSIDIYTYSDLIKWDMFDLYFVLKDEGLPVSRNFIYADWGAQNNCDWRAIPKDVKEDIANKLGYTTKQ